MSVWLRLIHEYSSILPKMIDGDPQYGEIFPSRLNPGKNRRTCEICGEEKSENMFYKDTNVCRECHEKQRNEVYTTITCVVCGRQFPFTRGEYEHYTKKGFTLPKRCPECRKSAK